MSSIIVLALTMLLTSKCFSLSLVTEHGIMEHQTKINGIKNNANRTSEEDEIEQKKRKKQ